MSDNSRPLNASSPNPVPRSDAPAPLPVEVRLVWPGGREEWAAAVATRWTPHHVLVEVPRGSVVVWLSAKDVRRT